MSWDYDEDQWEQDYYDTRCYPEEYDSIEEYELEHENYLGKGGLLSRSNGTRVGGNATKSDENPLGWLIGILVFMALIYAGYFLLIIFAIMPPLGALLFVGFLKLKGSVDI